MQTHNYPGLSEQLAAHKMYLERIQELVETVENGEEIDLIEVLVFLRDWLKSHIQGIDKKYGPYLNDRGVK